MYSQFAIISRLGRAAFGLTAALLLGTTFAQGAEIEESASQNDASSKLASEAMRLLHANCLGCHNAEKQKAGLQLTSRTALFKGSESGPVVVAGEPDESLLVKVLAADADPHMPPKKQLATNQISLLRNWIAAGAPWDETALAKAAAPRDVDLGTLPPSYRPVLALALTLDGKRLAVGRGNQIFVHDVAATNLPIIATLAGHVDVVRSLAWSREGRFLASGSFRTLTVWDATAGTTSWTVSSNLLGTLSALRFSPFGGALIAADAAAGQGGWVRIFAVENGKTLAAWRAHEDTIYDLSISPDGGFLASGSGDKLVKLWELISQKEMAQIEGHVGAVSGLAFNSNATELATVGSDKQFKVWDVKTRESIVTAGGRKHGFNAVAWSSDGNTVVAVDGDGRLIRFSDFKRHSGAQSSETFRERELARWAEPLHAVVINSNSTRIFAGGQDGVVYSVNGEGKLLMQLEPAAQAEAETDAIPPPPSFVRDVLPLLAKAGCMAGSCHAKPEGQNGFKLSVFSYDPKSDYHEIVKEGRGRRVFPAAPEESLILLKPTATIEHGGGQRIEPGSETYKTLVRWIRGGMVYQHSNEAALVGIRIEPRERSYAKNASQQLRVQAAYSDGSTRDVTALADYVSNEKEIAKVDERGLVRVGKVSGEGVIVARFMGLVDATRIILPTERKLPDERYASLPVNNFIDRLAYSHFRKLGLFPSEECSDAEFIRRSSLDAIGTLPTVEETRAFLADPEPGKRSKWIDRLLWHPTYADYWANKWADLLRPNPDRVGVKSVFLLDQWLRESFRTGKRYDQFVRDILLAEGSNHRDGPVVVYRDRRDPPELTTMFSQLFMGVRLECAKCHHHPNEKWSQDDFYQFAAFFGPMKQKGNGLSPPISGGTETFYFGAGRTVKHPVTDEVMKPRPPDGPLVNTSANSDPRRALADWLTDPTNPFFAKAAVNRVWAAFFGRGFVEPVDDFRISNPASNEPLLNALAEDFARHGYDLKHLMRTILHSRLYQLSSTPNEFNLADTKNFSRSYRRRLPAEVLLDAVGDITGVREEFNGCPPGTRAVQTWTYKVRSQFMDAFGRPNPSSDCPCERDLRTSVVQSLHMMNSKNLQAKLTDGQGRVKKLADSELTPEEITTELYLAAFSRFPTSEELKTATEAYDGEKVTRRAATEDLLWALLNSAEFVLNH